MTEAPDPQAARALAAAVIGQAVRDLRDPDERRGAARFFLEEGGAFAVYAATLDLDPDVVRERAYRRLAQHVGDLEAARLWCLASPRELAA